MHWYKQDPLDVEGWHDQNADTGLLPHGYWSLSLAEERQRWRLRLWEQNEDLDEIIDEPYAGLFPSETAANSSPCNAKPAERYCHERASSNAQTKAEVLDRLGIIARPTHTLNPAQRPNPPWG